MFFLSSPRASVKAKSIYAAATNVAKTTTLQKLNMHARDAAVARIALAR